MAIQGGAVILLKSPEMVAIDARNSLSVERLAVISFDMVKFYPLQVVRFFVIHFRQLIRNWYNDR